MFVNRVAKGIGALILLLIIAVIIPWLTPTPADKFEAAAMEESVIYVARRVQVVSLFSMVFIIAWIVLNIKVSKEYTNTVKSKLKLHWKRADTEVDEKLDVDFMKLVLDTLEDKNRSDVLYAMDLFDLTKRDKLTPEVRKLIGYKSEDMNVSSMEVLFQTEGATLAPQMDDAPLDERDEKEIKEIMQLDAYQEVMKDYMDNVLDSEKESSETARMEMAKGLGLMEASSPLVKKLEELIEDASLDVSRYAMDSAAKLKLREYIPQIIEKLKNPRSQSDASAALVNYGTKIIGTLSDYIGAPDEDLEIRISLTSVLSKIGNQETADYLSLELKHTDDGIESEIIDALDKIRSENADIMFTEHFILPKILKKMEDQYQTFLGCFEAAPPPVRKDRTGENPKAHKINFSNIFKLLGLLYPYEEILKAYQNIDLGTKDSIAYAVELLDNILPTEIKILLFPLIDNISIEERINLCREALPIFSSKRKQK